MLYPSSYLWKKEYTYNKSPLVVTYWMTPNVADRRYEEQSFNNKVVKRIHERIHYDLFCPPYWIEAEALMPGFGHVFPPALTAPVVLQRMHVTYFVYPNACWNALSDPAPNGLSSCCKLNFQLTDVIPVLGHKKTSCWIFNTLVKFGAIQKNVLYFCETLNVY